MTFIRNLHLVTVVALLLGACGPTETETPPEEKNGAHSTSGTEDGDAASSGLADQNPKENTDVVVPEGDGEVENPKPKDIREEPAAKDDEAKVLEMSPELRALTAVRKADPETLDSWWSGRLAGSAVVLTLDGLRRDDLNRPDVAPNLARLAQRSLRFERAYSANLDGPACAASMLSARYVEPGRVASYDEETQRVHKVGTLTQHAAFQGMQTGALISLPAEAMGSKRRERVVLREGFKVFVHQPDAKAPALSANAAQLIKATGKDRFLLWLDLDTLRRPFSAEDLHANPQRIHDGRLRILDRCVGQIEAGLKEAGRLNQTAIVLTAYRSSSLGEVGTPTRRNLLSEAVIRVPFLLAIPGVEGRAVSTPVDATDIAPTLGELMGWPSPGDAHGRSLLPLVAGGASEDPPQAAPVALSRATPSGGEKGRAVAVIVDRWKLVFDADDRRERLYDLDADPEEGRDLSSSRPEDLERMRRWLLAAQALVQDERTHEARLTDDQILADAWRLDPDERFEKVDEFLAQDRGDLAAKLILAALAEDATDPERCLALERVLVEAPPEARDAVIGATRAKSRFVRFYAALALTAYPQDAATEAALTKLRNDEHPTVKGVATLAAGILGDRGLMKSLRVSASRGLYRDRVLATIGLAALGDPPALRMIDSMILGGRLPRELESIAWRALNRRADVQTLPLRYLASLQPRRGSEREKLIARGSFDVDVELSAPLLRAFVRHPQSAIRDAARKALDDAGKSDWWERMRESERRLAFFRSRWGDLEANAAVVAFFATEFQRSFEAGYIDWGLAYEALIELRRRKADAEARALFVLFARRKEKMPPALRGLFGRFEALAAAGASPKPSLELTVAKNDFSRARGEAVWRVALRLAPDGGALVGDYPRPGAVLAGVMRQASQETPPEPQGLPIPSLGILPGERIDLLLSLPLEDLEDGSALALVALVDKGRPLSIVRQECRITP